VPVDPNALRYGSISEDLAALTGDDALGRALMLFHSPPYQTTLDRAALDGKRVDHVPLDVHVGSVAIRRFIERRQPRITMHGHIHESASITGSWKERIGATWCYSAAHRGGELALVRFDPDNPGDAVRELL
jgi:Icc-related predicted phosphoesterase